MALTVFLLMLTDADGVHFCSCPRNNSIDVIWGACVQGGAAVLRQTAWLLQLAALQLHRTDLAVLAHREDCKQMLASLYDVAPIDADAGVCFSALLTLLHEAEQVSHGSRLMHVSCLITVSWVR